MHMSDLHEHFCTMRTFKMLSTIFLISALPLVSASDRKSCPFPTPSSILPCECHFDEKFRIFLTCNLTQDMDDVIMTKLARGFGCKKEFFKFFVDLNGNDWTARFDEDTLGVFQMNHFHLVNFGNFVGNIKANSFNGSRNSIEEIIIDSSEKELLDDSEGSGEIPLGWWRPPTDDLKNLAATREIEKNAFYQLNALKKISLGNSFSVLQSHAFSQLKVLETIEFDPATVTKIASYGFNELKSLRVLDLGNQSITTIEKEAFKLLPNLTELKLNDNYLRQILDDTILPDNGVDSSLVTLDLSHNSELCRIGNMLRYQNIKDNALE